MIDKINSRKEFIDFIDSLRTDLVKNPNNWENKKLDDFLEAIARYTADIQGYYDNTKQNIDADKPEWQTFADILKGAAIYE